MKPKIEQRGKELTEARLTEVEKMFNIRLPDAYRAFMLENNGGHPEPNLVCRKRGKEPVWLCRYFYVIDSGRDFDDWISNFKAMKDVELSRLPPRLVPIAEDPGGDRFCISVLGKDAGKIYFWNHEEEFRLDSPDSGIPDDSGISLVADSFEQFLNQFAKDPDDEAKPKSMGWVKPIKACDQKGVMKWLDNGGQLDEFDLRSGKTPLHLAIEVDCYPILELLLNRGAKVESALGVAIQCQRWEIARSILQRAKGEKLQIDVSVFTNALKNCDDVSVIQQMLDAGAPLHTENFGLNALHFATMYIGNPQIVKLLIERGATLDYSLQKERSALANAICHGQFETVKILLDAGEDLYTVRQKKVPQEKTKMEIYYENEIEALKVLLANAASKNPDPQKKTKKEILYENGIENIKGVLANQKLKAPVYYLDKPKLPANFKKDVIEYATKLGQKPTTP
jgi:ankyrin repeat protein